MDNKKLLILDIAVYALVILVAVFFVVPNLRNGNQTEINNNTEIPEEIKKTETTVLSATDETTETTEDIQPQQANTQLLEAGWIPYWGLDSGYVSLVNNVSILEEINPVLYTIDTDGSLKRNPFTEETLRKILSLCKQKNIRVVPTIGSYVLENTSALLSSPANIKENIEDILKEIETYGYAGIDLDFETISASDAINYHTYLSELKTKLSKEEKILSVTVFPQWGQTIYSTHPDTRKAQDYAYINTVADEVRIMCYDYDTSVIGPLGPTHWIKEVLTYATKKIDKNKIYLGVHLYAYEWEDSTPTALTYSSLSNILSSSSITKYYDDNTGEDSATYKCGEHNCTLYYISPEGILARRNIAKQYGIKGISYWKLGGEDNLLK